MTSIVKSFSITTASVEEFYHEMVKEAKSLGDETGTVTFTGNITCSIKKPRQDECHRCCKNFDGRPNYDENDKPYYWCKFHDRKANFGDSCCEHQDYVRKG